MPYMLYHIPSGDNVCIKSSELEELGYINGVYVWKSKHSIKWMLLSAINQYNGRIDSEDFIPEQAKISSGKRIELDEFIVVRLSKNATFKPTKRHKIKRIHFGMRLNPNE